jgi:RNA polymerase sigma-70 factor (ECF subfamily)
LATIARRTAIDLYRREASRPTERLEDTAAADLPDGVDRAFDVWAVREAIDELPPLEREVIRLQHLESFTQAEIGARLDVPVNTIKSRSFRAHRRLADRLGHLRRIVA